MKVWKLVEKYIAVIKHKRRECLKICLSSIEYNMADQCLLTLHTYFWRNWQLLAQRTFTVPKASKPACPYLVCLYLGISKLLWHLNPVNILIIPSIWTTCVPHFQIFPWKCLDTQNVVQTLLRYRRHKSKIRRLPGLRYHKRLLN